VQRFLWGKDRGISTFAVSTVGNVLAYAAKVRPPSLSLTPFSPPPPSTDSNSIPPANALKHPRGSPVCPHGAAAIGRERGVLLQSGHADPCGRVQGEEPAVYIHTLDTLDTFATLLHVADSEVACLAFSRDGERLVTVTREPDLTLIVWHVATVRAHPPSSPW
jgi:hypothetical protein